jgi:sugar transferase (PEP-CTERM/EpsH1 system associated)
MRILFLTPILPIPTSGGRTRLYNLIRQLSDRHQVTVISFIQPSEHDMLPRVEPYCQRIELVPFEGFEPLGRWRNRFQGWRRILFSRRPRYADTFPVDSMRAPLQKLFESQVFDVIVFSHLYVAELMEKVGGIVPTILAEENVESDIAQESYVRAANPFHKLQDWLEWRKLLAFERRWVRRFPMCVAVSERDAAILQHMSPETQVHIVPNGVDSRSFAPRANQRDPQALLFFGTLSYGPNAEGLIWFCQEILPRVRQSRPDVKLEVVGLDPPPRVADLGRLPGVQVTGFVPDVRSKLWSATICVVPLLTGGGTRLKILEALAAGCPVISTTIGADGLSLVDGEHLLIADTPDQFAQGILALLESAELRRRLADAGREAVAQRYDWEQIALQLESACEQAVRQHRHRGYQEMELASQQSVDIAS